MVTAAVEEADPQQEFRCAGMFDHAVDELLKQTPPGFHGPLDSTKCNLCKGRSQPASVFYEHIVIQLSRNDGERTPPCSQRCCWSQKFFRGTEACPEAIRKPTRLVTQVWFLLLVLAIGAFLAAVKAHRHRQEPTQYIDLNSLGYTPPML
ncbi:hypothetical protein SELMODRAFT_421887 [Selaginella moellendorffii]|uniref:Uncharacterized protein n=1 Tax=Selaginella moellendorffii TaxID=88036 RepID=D8SGN5_SELML|nr:hypothetical protein SELMODRAFT_421887 [Selaginella moellendorffii]